MTNVKLNLLFKFKMVYLGVIGFMLLSACVFPANADVLFEDNFNITSDDVNRDIWTSVEWVSPTYNPAFFGRTAIRNPKIPLNMTEGLPTTVKVEDDLAKLKLDTYNPTDSNNPKTSFWGSEIDTGHGHDINNFTTFKPQSTTEGISFEARIRPFPYPLDPDEALPGGIVTSVFAYGVRNETDGRRDEIDFEFLTKQGANKVYFNYFADTADGVGNIVNKTVAGFDATQFYTVKINWFTDKIEWYVNNVLVHTVNNATDGVAIPQGPMGLRLNIWAANDTWTDAYNNDTSFHPVSNIADNRAYIYEVEYAKVNAVPEPISCALFLLGAGALAGARRLCKKV